MDTRSYHYLTFPPRYFLQWSSILLRPKRDEVPLNYKIEKIYTQDKISRDLKSYPQPTYRADLKRGQWKYGSQKEPRRFNLEDSESVDTFYQTIQTAFSQAGLNLT